MQGVVPVRRDLAVLYAAVLASRIGFGIIIIIFPTYIRSSLDATDLQIAATLALYPLLEAAAAIPIGIFVDSHGRKWMFVGSLAYISALMASIGLTRNLYAIASIHALMGIGAAGVTVATLTMVTDLTGTGNRGKGMGTFDFSNVGGYAIGLVTGAALASTFASDLSTAFYIGGAVIGAAFLVAIAILKEPPHMIGYRQPSLNPLYSLDAHSKSILPIWIGVTILLGMVFFLPTAFGSVSVGSTQTALILVAGLVALGVGAIGFGAISDKVGRGKVLIVGVVGLFGLMTWLLLFGGGRLGSILSISPLHLLLLGIFALMTSALVPSILATVGDRALLEGRGSAMGLYSVMLSGGTAIGTIMAGIAHRRAGLTGIYEAGIILFMTCCLVSLALQIWVRSKR